MAANKTPAGGNGRGEEYNHAVKLIGSDPNSAATKSQGAPCADGNVIIAEFPKSHHDIIRVELTRYKGVDMVAVRAWYTDTSGHKRPSRNGINVKASLLPAVIAALRAAQAALPDADAEVCNGHD